MYCIYFNEVDYSLLHSLHHFYLQYLSIKHNTINNSITDEQNYHILYLTQELGVHRQSYKDWDSGFFAPIVWYSKVIQFPFPTRLRQPRMKASFHKPLQFLPLLPCQPGLFYSSLPRIDGAITMYDGALVLAGKSTGHRFRGALHLKGNIEGEEVTGRYKLPYRGLLFVVRSNT